MKHFIQKNKLTICGSKGGGSSAPPPPTIVTQYPSVLTPPSVGDMNSISSFSYAEMVDLLSDGPIEGIVNREGKKVYDENIFEGIYLNDTPVKETSLTKNVALPINNLKNKLKLHWSYTPFITKDSFSQSYSRFELGDTNNYDTSLTTQDSNVYIKYLEDIKITTYSPNSSLFNFVNNLNGSFDYIKLIEKSFSLIPIQNEKPFLTQIDLPRIELKLPKIKFDVTEGGSTADMPIQLSINNLADFIYFSISADTLVAYNSFEMPRSFVENSDLTSYGKKTFPKTLTWQDNNYAVYSAFNIRIFIWSIYNSITGIKNINDILDTYFKYLIVNQNDSSLYNYTLVQSELKTGTEIQTPLKNFASVEIDTAYNKELIGPFRLRNDAQPTNALAGVSAGGVQRLKSFQKTMYTCPLVNIDSLALETSDDIRYIKSWPVEYDNCGNPFLICNLTTNFSQFDLSSSTRVEQFAQPITHYVENQNVTQAYVTIQVNALSDTNHIDLVYKDSPTIYGEKKLTRSDQTDNPPAGQKKYCDLPGNSRLVGNTSDRLFLLAVGDSAQNSYVVDGVKGYANGKKLGCNLQCILRDSNFYYEAINPNNGLGSLVANINDKIRFNQNYYKFDDELYKYMIPNQICSLNRSFPMSAYYGNNNLMEKKLQLLDNNGNYLYCFGLSPKEKVFNIGTFSIRDSNYTDYVDLLSSIDSNNGRKLYGIWVDFYTQSLSTLRRKAIVGMYINRFIPWSLIFKYISYYHPDNYYGVNMFINGENDGILINKSNYPSIYKYIILQSFSSAGNIGGNQYTTSRLGTLLLVGMNYDYLSRDATNWNNNAVGTTLKLSVIERLMENFFFSTDTNLSINPWDWGREYNDASLTKILENILSSSEIQNSNLISLSNVYRFYTTIASDFRYFYDQNQINADPLFKFNITSDRVRYNLYENNLRQQGSNIYLPNLLYDIINGNDVVIYYDLVNDTIPNTNKLLTNNASYWWDDTKPNDKGESPPPSGIDFSQGVQTMTAGTKLPAIVAVQIETGYDSNEKEVWIAGSEYFSYKFDIYGIANSTALIDLGRRNYDFVYGQQLFRSILEVARAGVEQTIPKWYSINMHYWLVCSRQLDTCVVVFQRNDTSQFEQMKTFEMGDHVHDLNLIDLISTVRDISYYYGPGTSNCLTIRKQYILDSQYGSVKYSNCKLETVKIGEEKVYMGGRNGGWQTRATYRRGFYLDLATCEIGTPDLKNIKKLDNQFLDFFTYGDNKDAFYGYDKTSICKYGDYRVAYDPLPLLRDSFWNEFKNRTSDKLMSFEVDMDPNKVTCWPIRIYDFSAKWGIGLSSEYDCSTPLVDKFFSKLKKDGLIPSDLEASTNNPPATFGHVIKTLINVKKNCTYEYTVKVGGYRVFGIRIGGHNETRVCSYDYWVQELADNFIIQKFVLKASNYASKQNINPYSNLYANDKGLQIDLPAPKIDKFGKPIRRYIKVTKLSHETLSSLIVKSIGLSKITEIIPQKFSYPFSALMGTKLDARAFAQIPTRTFTCKLKKVLVPSNYFPLDEFGADIRYYDKSNTRKIYVGDWDGLFKHSWTDNPAWILMDILINKRYGMGNYIEPNQIDIWELYKIARWCDGVFDDGRYHGVPDTLNGVEPRHAFNGHLTDKFNVFDMVNQIASVFRGHVYYMNSLITFDDDRPKAPIGEFNNSDVKDGLFNYTNHKKDEEFTAVEVSFIDAKDNFKPKVEYIEDSEAIRKRGILKKQINAFGVTSKSQARRLGLHFLYQSAKENNNISFITDTRALLYKPGDLVNINDELYNSVKNFGFIKEIKNLSDRTFSIVIDKVLDSKIYEDKEITIYTPIAKPRYEDIYAKTQRIPNNIIFCGFRNFICNVDALFMASEQAVANANSNSYSTTSSAIESQIAGQLPTGSLWNCSWLTTSTLLLARADAAILQCDYSMGGRITLKCYYDYICSGFKYNEIRTLVAGSSIINTNTTNYSIITSENRTSSFPDCIAFAQNDVINLDTSVQNFIAKCVPYSQTCTQVINGSTITNNYPCFIDVCLSYIIDKDIYDNISDYGHWEMTFIGDDNLKADKLKFDITQNIENKINTINGKYFFTSVDSVKWMKYMATGTTNFPLINPYKCYDFTITNNKINGYPLFTIPSWASSKVAFSDIIENDKPSIETFYISSFTTGSFKTGRYINGSYISGVETLNEYTEIYLCKYGRDARNTYFLSKIKDSVKDNLDAITLNSSYSLKIRNKCLQTYKIMSIAENYINEYAIMASQYNLTKYEEVEEKVSQAITENLADTFNALTAYNGQRRNLSAGLLKAPIIKSLTRLRIGTGKYTNLLEVRWASVLDTTNFRLYVQTPSKQTSNFYKDVSSSSYVSGEGVYIVLINLDTLFGNNSFEIGEYTVSIEGYSGLDANGTYRFSPKAQDSISIIDY